MKNIFSPIKFLKFNNCYLCHNIKKSVKLAPNLKKIKNFYKINYKNKKHLFKKIKFGNKNIFKKNIIMPSFLKIKKKCIYFFIKWLLNIL
ncbi:putative cytochrome c, class I [Candidatus Nasuia deltocephalinicola str. NAS-ALF]|uniref:Cytochrome c, class I n=1 Tax=Candidatus Nasuia deltocephalinicola str. NAS-ALF TaxID=1343077 RepID=S5SY57_9PROT|nr:putative cytochrome c, class I [Candidatus Nasuia deltocephalinicola str. NAS-ALF]